MPSRNRAKVQQSVDDTLISSDDPRYYEEEGRREAAEVEEESGCCCSCASPLCAMWTMSIAFFFVFTGFSGVQNLESSLDLGQVSGSVSVGIIYITFTFICLLAPFIIRVVGSKTSIVAQFIIIGVYCATNIFPRVYTMYPASVLLGIGAGPMWVAQGEYVSTLAEQHTSLTGLDDAFGTFNGIFYGVFQMTQVSGNLISALVLNNGKDTSAPTHAPTPADLAISVDDLALGSGKKHVDKGTEELLFVIYIGCCAIGAFLFQFCVAGLRKGNQPCPEGYSQIEQGESTRHTGKREPTVLESVGATFRLMVKPRCFFLIPLMLANGFEMGFAYSTLTGTIIKTNLGEPNIGWGMICFGVADVLSSIFFGRLADIIGVTGPLCLASVIQCLAGYWIWANYPSLKEDAWLPIMVICGVWGFCDGIANTLISAMLGQRFPDDKEAAFANWKMFQSAGVSILYFVQDYLELRVKLVMVFASWALGIVGLLGTRFCCSYMTSLDSEHEGETPREQKDSRTLSPNSPTVSAR